MSLIEMSSGIGTVITTHIHYRFVWMGDHWKQEIEGVGDGSALPKIWSVEGPISHEGPSRNASPTFQTLDIKKREDGVAVARLGGRSGGHRSSASIAFEERPNEVDVAVEVAERGDRPGEAPMVTYLIDSSSAHLEREGPAAITWPHPNTRLLFEAEAPAHVEILEAGHGTIRLKAIAEHDPSSEVQTLRYRWKWITTPGHQIWDREV